jgi:FkbM family methyltransferase
VQDLMLALTREGDTILDLGANVGAVTIPLAKRGRRVFAFELLSDNARAIEKAAVENGIADKVIVKTGAVSDRRGIAHFNGKSAWGMVAEGGEFSVESIVVDDLAADIGPVRAIKADIEGSELSALQGMEKLLSEHRPSVIFEGNTYTSALRKTTVKAVADYLESHGYRVLRIDVGSDVLVPWGGDLQPSLYEDYLATVLSDKDLLEKTGRRVRRQTLEEYAGAIRKEEDKPGDAYRAYVAAIADLFPAAVRRHPVCRDTISKAAADLGQGELAAICRAGLGLNSGNHLSLDGMPPHASSPLRRFLKRLLG